MEQSEHNGPLAKKNCQRNVHEGEPVLYRLIRKKWSAWREDLFIEKVAIPVSASYWWLGWKLNFKGVPDSIKHITYYFLALTTLKNVHPNSTY